MSKLTAKQEMFCKEYLVDLNATQAAIRAGYSKKTAQKIGSENLLKPLIANQIQILFDTRAEKVELNSEYVVKRLQSIDEMDVIEILDDEMNIKPISEWPKTWRTSISGIDLTEISGNNKEEKTISLLKKIKWPDKVKNLELLGRHFKLFTDKVDLTGDLVVKTTRKRFDGSE
jgi:phage terminase small subunit